MTKFPSFNYVRGIGRRSCGTGAKSYRETWRRRYSFRLKDEHTSGVSSYLSYVADAASVDAYNRQDENVLLSAESLPENTGLVDFSTFAQDYPDKLFPLLAHLRPEFQELFIEYYILHMPQSFIGETHGCIQTRIWQALRIIERMIGAMILLGPAPTLPVLYQVTANAGLENTPHGSLSKMIFLYAQTQSYAAVAKQFSIPTPTVRKIFRPAIKLLLAGKDIKTVAVGAYLRNLTHQSSLTKSGPSKQAVARLKRVNVQRFAAPPLEVSPLVSFGAVQSLKDAPWHMIEIASEHRMSQIMPLLLMQAKRTFSKRPGQIFAPVNEDGDLTFGYIFARSNNITAIRMLVHTRGLAGVAAQYDGDGKFTTLVTIPNTDVEKMIRDTVTITAPAKVRKKDFVEILSGPASHYCGTVVQIEGEKVVVEVNFPTGRKFIVQAARESIKRIDIPKTGRTFWGF